MMIGLMDGVGFFRCRRSYFQGRRCPVFKGPKVGERGGAMDYSYSTT